MANVLAQQGTSIPSFAVVLLALICCIERPRGGILKKLIGTFISHDTEVFDAAE